MSVRWQEIGKIILLFTLIGLWRAFSPSLIWSQGLQADLEDRAFLTMELEKGELYLNELVSLKVKLFAKDVHLRNIELPQIDHPAFTVRGFENPIEKRELRRGLLYDVLEFKTTLFPTETGQWILGPAVIGCELFFRDEGIRGQTDYFGRDEGRSVRLESNTISLTVKPLPSQGRPPRFGGAVGQFDLSVEVEPEEMRTGDPLLLRMTIRGRGNFHTVTSPEIVAQGGHKTYPPRVVQTENEKVFEHVLLPLQGTIKSISPVVFTFFDPEKGAYFTLRKGPIPVRMKTHLAETPSQEISSNHQRIPIQPIAPLKSFPGKLKGKESLLLENPYFLFLQGGFLLLLFPLYGLHRHQQRMKRDPRYVGRRKASKQRRKAVREMEALLQGRTSEFYDSVDGHLKKYLGDRFQMLPGEITSDQVNARLTKERSDEDIQKALEHLFEVCGRVRYGGQPSDPEEKAKVLGIMKMVMDRLKG